MSQNTTRVDAAVVGAGSAGCAAAAFLAEQGLRVVVLDRRAEAMAGARWVNGVPAWCFEAAGVEAPTGAENWGGGVPHGFVIQAAGTSSRAKLERSPALHVDMRILTARLRARALMAGVDFQQVRVTETRTNMGRVEQIVAVTPNGEQRQITAPLFVDASGHARVLRRQMAEARWHGSPIWVCAAAQHQVQVRSRAGLEGFLERHGAKLGDSLAVVGLEGGFSTLTLFSNHENDEVGVLTGSLPSLGAAPGSTMLSRFIRQEPWLGRLRWGGAGPIALDRLANPLGVGGVALVGESAGQVYASHGSGVGLGLVAARLLARAVRIHSDPGSEAALRDYDELFRDAHGGLLERSLSFFHLSRGLDANTTAALLDAGVLSPKLLRAGLEQVDPPLGPSEAAGLAARVLSRPGLLKGLGRAAVASWQGRNRAAEAPARRIGGSWGFANRQRQR